jgi:FixJ family two-component response regulator
MSSTGQGHVIYIIEEDTGVREGLCRLVRSAGLEARPFGTTDQFLAEVESPASGCILLDITPPAAGSAGLQRALRARDIQLPLIAISARHDAATRRRARALGSCFFMGKPVDDQALLDAIEWAIETGRNGTTG